MLESADDMTAADTAPNPIIATAGGVISTGSANIMGATMRMPFRGWFISDNGEDMELNGAQPNYEVRNLPGELSASIDHQLEKAVTVLLEQAAKAKKGPGARYRSTSEHPSPSKPEPVIPVSPVKSTEVDKPSN